MVEAYSNWQLANPSLYQMKLPTLPKNCWTNPRKTGASTETHVLPYQTHMYQFQKLSLALITIALLLFDASKVAAQLIMHAYH